LPGIACDAAWIKLPKSLAQSVNKVILIMTMERGLIHQRPITPNQENLGIPGQDAAWLVSRDRDHLIYSPPYWSRTAVLASRKK